jgi:anti-anti-sigma factor
MLEQSHEMKLVCSRGAAGATLIRVIGDVDAAAVPALEHALSRAAAADRPVSIDLDLSSVTFFSCTGLAALRECREGLDGELRVVAASRAVQRVAQLAGAPWLIN